MKKLSAILVGMSLVAGAVMAAEPVTSVNVVGYVNTPTLAAKYKLLGVSFNKVGGGPMTIIDVLGTNSIPDGAIVFLYDGLKYVGENFVEGFGWDPGTNDFSRADGFWFTSPNSFDLTMAGEAPSAANAPTSTITLAHGYQLLSNPYPTTMILSNSGLASVASDGDLVIRWTGTAYSGSSFVQDYGWDPGSLSIGPGEGFWYYKLSPGTTNWVEVKPYSFP